MLEISDVLNKYPSSVSGGQQQRASLGRALVRKAGLYLLDEPMGQLEPQLRAVLRGRIKHYLREHNCTTILVTHDQTEANALADRIAVMEGGVLQQYATPAELKARPANLFIGTFIGEPPMNVFPCPVSDDGKMIALRHRRQEVQRLSYAVGDFLCRLRQRLKQEPSLMLGVRPHAVHIGRHGFKARVVTCQWLGDQTHVAAEVAGRTVVSVAHDRVISAKPGSEVCSQLAPQDLHLFDAGTGTAIAHGGVAGMKRRRDHRHRCRHFGHQIRRFHASRRADSRRPPSRMCYVTLADGGVEQDMARTWRIRPQPCEHARREIDKASPSRASPSRSPGRATACG